MLYFATVGATCLMPASPIQFDEFSLDCDRYELLRSGRPVKLERIPMELLILLATNNGNLVTRQEIIERLWGKNVFVDTEHGINTAIRKIRVVLKDNPEKPRFVQTVTGKGYRFVAELTEGNGAKSRLSSVEAGSRPQLPDALPKISLKPAARWLNRGPVRVQHANQVEAGTLHGSGICFYLFGRMVFRIVIGSEVNRGHLRPSTSACKNGSEQQGNVKD